MNITENTTILHLVPVGYKYDHSIEMNMTTHEDFYCKHIYFKKQETPEQQANKLGFKVGDECWSNKRYLGKIIEFDLGRYDENKHCLYAKFNKDNVYANISNITNNIAVHCPTKEDFKFIDGLLNRNTSENIKVFTNAACILVNTNEWKFKEEVKDYLILSVEKYCQAIGMKPLFVTEDSVNVYKSRKYYFIWNNEVHSEFAYNLDYYNTTETFSTQQAAQQYLDNQILFYTEDFKDGSFPVKSCRNCKKAINKGWRSDISGYSCQDRCINDNCLPFEFNYWQGELKGKPIRKGDKCWRSDISGYSCQDWASKTSPKDYTKYKYFSNEQNARNYYAKLQEESKPKFEIGKWYERNNGIGTSYFCYQDDGKTYGLEYWNKVYNWVTMVFLRTDLLWQLADMNKVEELLSLEAKKRYPAGTSIKSLDDGSIWVIDTFDKTSNKSESIWLRTTAYASAKVYDNGKWAEIVKTNNSITLGICKGIIDMDKKEINIISKSVCSFKKYFELYLKIEQLEELGIKEYTFNWSLFRVKRSDDNTYKIGCIDNVTRSQLDHIYNQINVPINNDITE